MTSDMLSPRTPPRLLACALRVDGIEDRVQMPSEDGRPDLPDNRPSKEKAPPGPFFIRRRRLPSAAAAFAGS